MDGEMDGSNHVMALLWVGVGIILGFFVWSYIQPMLPATTTA
jgi:hypothetical protein